jgi:hypothetical protein
MKVSWTSAAATRFSLYLALRNLGSAIGPFATRLGLADAPSYLACGALAALPVPFLILLDPDKVERRRLSELTATTPP